MIATEKELVAFAELVKQMRKNQKEYFKSRSQDALLKSKELESLVDKNLKEFEDRKQPKLL